MITNNIQYQPLFYLVASLIDDSAYVPINPNGLSVPCPYVKVANFSDSLLLFSIDGQTDHFIIAPGNSAAFSAQFSKQIPTKTALFPKGTVFYAKALPGAPDPNGLIALVSYSQYRN